MDFESRLRTVTSVSRGLLALVDEETKREFARRATVEAHRFGDVVINAGDVGQAMYFIAAGKARIVGVDARGSETTLAVLRRQGDHFGEDALLGGRPHATSVRAADDLVLLRLSRADFDATLGTKQGILETLRRYQADASIRDFLK